MGMRVLFLVISMLFAAQSVQAAYMLVPMDDRQSDHLKAYGVTFWVLDKKVETYWLLNYRGGSFAFRQNAAFEKECKTRNVKYEVISDAQFNGILTEISHPEKNMDAIKLETAPKVAVYTPQFNAKGERVQPWDDAVTLVLTYAEIPYETIYDSEVLAGDLALYDWLHLHHEDFTGQYGRFYKNFHTQPWYRENVKQMEALAAKEGYSKVSQLKLGVVKAVRDFVGGGGFMFAMCSATDTYDIALASDGIDICADIYDGDAADPDADSKLNFDNTFAFKDFQLMKNPLEYEFSTIDPTLTRRLDAKQDYFTLFDFSAKWDPIPTMLTQNHTRTVKGFMGQTTAYRTKHIKSSVLILGETKPVEEARYIHGSYGEGTWTFYGGHDPEDYRHYVNDPETDLSLHPHSPGYRLILNNVLFPAAEKKKRKT
ncbi:MAG: asparagine synthetase B [Saprospiraceae bacterium]